jgi:hypothetical protein
MQKYLRISGRKVLSKFFRRTLERLLNTTSNSFINNAAVDPDVEISPFVPFDESSLISHISQFRGSLSRGATEIASGGRV